MKIVKSSLSIKIIYWITNFSLAILILIFLTSIVFNILLYTDFFGNNLQLHTRFPVKIDILEIGNLRLDEQEVKIEFVEAVTKIHFINTPIFIAKKIGIIVPLVTLGMVFLTWIFRSFIYNVKSGEVFSLGNIFRLKKLSYGIAAIWLFTVIYMRIFYYMIVKRIEFENVHLTNDFSSYPGILILALSIWVLAHIFMSGLELQKEKDLTV